MKLIIVFLLVIVFFALREQEAELSFESIPSYSVKPSCFYTDEQHQNLERKLTRSEIDKKFLQYNEDDLSSVKKISEVKPISKKVEDPYETNVWGARSSNRYYHNEYQTYREPLIISTDMRRDAPEIDQSDSSLVADQNRQTYVFTVPSHTDPVPSNTREERIRKLELLHNRIALYYKGYELYKDLHELYTKPRN